MPRALAYGNLDAIQWSPTVAPAPLGSIHYSNRCQMIRSLINTEEKELWEESGLNYSWNGRHRGLKRWKHWLTWVDPLRVRWIIEIIALHPSKFSHRSMLRKSPPPTEQQANSPTHKFRVKLDRKVHHVGYIASPDILLHLCSGHSNLLGGWAADYNQ